MAQKMTPEQNLEVRAELFKALGHPVRLLILNLIKIQPRHGEELATILHLKPATISHHLSKLSDVGLLTSQKDQYYQTYSLVGEPLKKTIEEVVYLPQERMDAQVKEDAYRTKVLRTFIKHGRITGIPSQLKKRLIILEHILEEFEPERKYTEHEVNLILLDFHEDVALLRRELADHGYMEREAGIYWRAKREM
ncbi:MAG: metalloregulator ArsR/SmtB family transcription factor [Anaerolineae bacterium]|nr:metalloregulator ArsR/SmtB family transcription factor [Anaerolineae bacterium]